MDVSSVPAVSCLVFFVVVVVLLSIIYQKDQHCCKLRSCRGQRADRVRPYKHTLPFCAVCLPSKKTNDILYSAKTKREKLCDNSET